MIRKPILKIDGKRNGRIPGLVMTNNGTLLAYFENRLDHGDWANIDIKVLRSTDKGENWTETYTIPSNGNTMNNPVMIVNDNEIVLLYLENYNRLFVCKSYDDGITFGEATEITSIFDKAGITRNCIAVGPGHGIVHNGTLLAPVWFSYDPEDPKAHWPSWVTTIYSKDGGDTWQLGEVIGKDIIKCPNESALAVLRDNRVFISMRNMDERYHRAISVSDNGYSGWETPVFCDNLPDPMCMGSLDSLDDKMYHINCNSTTNDFFTGRKNLTIKISDDNFRTYDKILVDEEGGYSDIAVTEDTIYVFYERDVVHDGLYFAKINRPR